MHKATAHPSKLAFTVTEFCAACSISRSTFYLEAKAGRISVLKAGKRTLIASSEAERWLSALPTSQRP